MTTVRNFVMVCAGIGLAWLLWRVNAAIGDQALLMLLGLIIGMAVAALALFAFSVVASTRQPPAPPAQPQTTQWQPPVIVLLGDSQRSTAPRYAAPAALFAQPAEREVGEKDAWVDGESWGGGTWRS